ncbi:MAG: RsmE family RNA methyltransferase [Planctomycetota bacterium]
MSLPRFYLPELTPYCELSKADSIHASNVLRLSVGEAVEVFDGMGNFARAEITQSGKRATLLELDEIQRDASQSKLDLHMVVALPKGDRQKVLIDGLTQLGVSSVIPLICERQVAQAAEKSLERLRRGVIESCKQCGRNHLMEIQSAKKIDELIADSQTATCCFAHPYALSAGSPLPISEFTMKLSSEALVLVGPEGGLSDDECERLLDAGWQNVSLGPHILRIEMAAISSASQLLGQVFSS